MRAIIVLQASYAYPRSRASQTISSRWTKRPCCSWPKRGSASSLVLASSSFSDDLIGSAMLMLHHETGVYGTEDWCNNRRILVRAVCQSVLVYTTRYTCEVLLLVILTSRAVESCRAPFIELQYNINAIVVQYRNYALRVELKSSINRGTS